MTLKHSQTTQNSSQALKNVHPASPNKTSSAQTHKYPQNSYQIQSQHQVPRTWVKQHPTTPKIKKTNEIHLQALSCTTGSIFPSNARWLSPARLLRPERQLHLQIHRLKAEAQSWRQCAYKRKLNGSIHPLSCHRARQKANNKQKTTHDTQHQKTTRKTSTAGVSWSVTGIWNVQEEMITLYHLRIG